MDSQQLHRYSVISAGISYASSHLTPPAVPESLFGSAKLNTRNSPNSPLSATFECDTTTTPTHNSLDQYSSSENLLSRMSSSWNSPINTGYYYSHSPFSSQGCSFTSYGRYNANGGQGVNLMQLETTLMGPDNDENNATAPTSSSRVWNQDPQLSHIASFDPSYAASRQNEFHIQQHCQGKPFGNLKQLLIDCASALSENRVDDVDRLVEHARGVVSITGDPIQRLSAYMIEGLVARKESSGTGIYRSLGCKEPLGKELFSYMHILYEICPYVKFGYMAANGAIAEACKNENRIHIIDFQIAQGSQWTTLLQALAARPGGPPHVRITGIDDPVSKYARGTGLEAVGKCLAAISEKFKIPLEFHALPVFGPDVSRDMLELRPGEAVAVNFPLQLHHTPDESVDVKNPRDGLLRMVKSLSPKVMTLVEQESNTNTTPFMTRFVETLDYYSAMFESIDVALSRDKKERVNMEQHCLAKDIVNVIACEGKERVERHELLGKWRSRLTMAGFRSYPLSSYVNSVIGRLVKRYSEHYAVVEKDGAVLLGWKNRMLISASAWH